MPWNQTQTNWEIELVIEQTATELYMLFLSFIDWSIDVYIDVL